MSEKKRFASVETFTQNSTTLSSWTEHHRLVALRRTAWGRRVRGVGNLGWVGVAWGRPGGTDASRSRVGFVSCDCHEQME